MPFQKRRKKITGTEPRALHIPYSTVGLHPQASGKFEITRDETPLDLIVQLNGE